MGETRETRNSANTVLDQDSLVLDAGG